jgi:polysaccharide export outer membrane protein
MKTAKLLIAACTTLMVAACSTPKNFNYFQDLSDGQEIKMPEKVFIRLQPQDRLMIMVSSKDPQMSALFNKGLRSSVSGNKLDANKYITNYTIDNDGCVNIPVLGPIKISGLTRFETEQLIQEKLREELLKDAVVTVEYADLRFSVVGEVSAPGQFWIGKDMVTLTDALNEAGGITIYGKRDSVMVIRETPTGRKVYVVNMNSAKDLFASEAYYIKQNDIINVKANDTRARQSLANGNETRSLSFWMSIVSVAATLAMLIFK